MSTTLDVRAVSDMQAARSDVESLGSAVRGLGSDLDAASSDARSASLDLDRVGEGSDAIASRSSQAAGGLGDLAGGLDAVGATGAASALNGVALASQVAAGAGDIMNLVAETSVGKFVLQTGAAIAHRTATIAGAVATGAMTAAQGALNAVMSLNPVAIIVLALIALTAALVLAYKHSETFRNIVDGAFSKAREVVEGAVDAVSSFIDWTRNLPGEARQAWDAVSGAIGDKVGEAVGFVTDLYDDVRNGVDNIKDDVAGAFSFAFSPIETAVGWVRDLIDLIGDIDFPDPPDWLDAVIPGRAFAGIPGNPHDTSPGEGRGARTVNVTVNGAVDPVATARQIRRLLAEADLLDGAPDWGSV